MSCADVLAATLPASRGSTRSTDSRNSSRKRNQLVISFRSIKNLKESKPVLFSRRSSPKLKTKEPTNPENAENLSDSLSSFGSEICLSLSQLNSERVATAALSPRQKVHQIIRKVSAKNRQRLLAKQFQIDLEKELEHMKASETAFFKNGKEMWSRETQTNELRGLEIPEAQDIAVTIKRDMELSRAVMKATCGLRLRESQILLYSLMSKKMKDLEVRYDVRLKQVEKEMKVKLKSDVAGAQAALEIQNERALSEATLEKKMAAEKQRRILERFQNLYRKNTPEHQALKYKAAKMYIKLKRRQLPDDLETSPQADIEKTQFVAVIDRLRHEIRLAEDEIRVLQPKLFKMEEDVDKTQSRKRDAANVFAKDKKTRRVNMNDIQLDSASTTLSQKSNFAVDEATKTYVKEKLTADYEAYTQECRTKMSLEYSEIQKNTEKKVAEWDMKFKSAEAMFDREKRNRMFQTQNKLLKMVSGMIISQTRKYRKDASIKCTLMGATIVELLEKEMIDFKAKFSSVLLQLTGIVREKKKQKRMAEEKEAAEMAAAAEAVAYLRIRKEREERLNRAKLMHMRELSKIRVQPEAKPPPATSSQVKDDSKSRLKSPDRANPRLKVYENRERAGSVITPSAELLIPQLLGDVALDRRILSLQSNLLGASQSVIQKSISQTSTETKQLVTPSSVDIGCEISIAIQEASNVDLKENNSLQDSEVQIIPTAFTYQRQASVLKNDRSRQLSFIPSQDMQRPKSTLLFPQISSHTLSLNNDISRSKSSCGARQVSILYGFDENEGQSSDCDIVSVRSRTRSIMAEEDILKGWLSPAAAMDFILPEIIETTNQNLAETKKEPSTFTLPELTLDSNSGDHHSKVETTVKQLHGQTIVLDRASSLLHSNTQMANLYDDSIQYFQDYMAEHNYLKSMKKSVAKGLYGIDMKKPQHFPPVKMGINGNNLPPIADGVRFPYLKTRMKAREMYKDINIPATKRKKKTQPPVRVQPVPQETMNAKSLAMTKDKRDQQIPDYNIRPWSSVSVDVGSILVAPEGCLDKTTEDQENTGYMDGAGVYGISLRPRNSGQRRQQQFLPQLNVENALSEFRPQPVRNRRVQPREQLPPCLTGSNIVSRK
ncbi:hypothetical protein BDR26DRAFT_866744 [Obelidium mucronatum]|nr:hypothetical protein BDR26DRAFT_866744 [Obelidium mucronatum]